MSCELVAELETDLALGLATDEETRRAEAHVAVCPTCAERLDGLRATLAALALTAPRVEPPLRLKARVLAEATRLRAPAPLKTSGRPGWLGWLPTRAWAALAAGLATIALAAGVWGYSLQAELNRQQVAYERLSGAYRQVVAVLAADRLEERDLNGGPGAPTAWGRLYVNPATGQGMLMARDLPPPPEGTTYQIWLIRQGERTSGGFIRMGDDGVGYALLNAPEGRWTYDAVGVTREPTGGSPGPTGPQMLFGRI